MPRLPGPRTLLASCILAISHVNAQCLNNVAVYNPDLRTLTANNTWFVVPVPKAAAQKALDAAYPLGNLTLLDVPNDSTLFSQPFPSGYQPVLTTAGLEADIRQSITSIAELKNAVTNIAYVSRNGSPAPLQATVSNYIAGPDGPLPEGLVPAIASPLLFGGAPVRLGTFDPAAQSYASEGSSIFYSDVSWAILPNPLSGPGIEPEAFDYQFTFSSPSTSRFTDKGFKYLINLPTVSPDGQCQRNAYYFNNATAETQFLNGNVTFGPGADGSGLTTGVLMQASPGGYGVNSDVDGFAACAQQVGYELQTCDEASQQMTLDLARLV